MKHFLVSLAMLSLIVLFSCSRSPNNPPDISDPGSANISINIGKVGALGKVRNIELCTLFVTLSAPGETFVRDTILLSGNAGGMYSRTYPNLASLLKTWTLTAEAYDCAGVLIYSGSTQFIVPARATIPVTLNLNAKYSMLKANFFPIRDSVTRCELLVNSVKRDDSTFAKQALLGDTVRLSYNYLDTGAAQRIKLDVYGIMWGFDTLLYTGDTLVRPQSGANTSYTITLKWVGPALPPPGQASMSVVLGPVRTVTVNGEIQNTLTDIDGNVYHTVKIGTQTWTVENLKTTRYNDGSAIPLVTDAYVWAALTTPGRCWYNNDSITYHQTYGVLYNWYVVNTGKLAPIGWHVPTDAEWTTLAVYLGGESAAGGKLKHTGTSFWNAPNTGATNETGFSALPGGTRFNFVQSGNFSDIRNLGFWWSSTFSNAVGAYCRYVDAATATVGRNDYYNGYGHSVRLVRDW